VVRLGIVVDPVRTGAFADDRAEMILLDLTHTSHTRARTGIQRVCRSLWRALDATGSVTAICHDPYQRAWRPLQAWETENLESNDPAAGRGARWPLSARLAGRGSRLLARRAPALPEGDLLLVPEVFSAATTAALPLLDERVSGPRVAVFHDAIALKYPELSPSKTVARFPAYLHELARFDGVAAVSEDSKACLEDFWRWAGVADSPPVEAITLGLDPLAVASEPTPAGDDLTTVLSVGSIEGRKNHLALLEACERLWAEGRRFRLRLVGLAHPQTGRAALQRVRALQAAGRELTYDGPVDEAGLMAAYRNCTFTVYPSLIEGFGLPVLESLRHGKACICSKHGALGESTRGGGCIALDDVDASHLAAAIDRLLTEPTERERLQAEAGLRTFKSWNDYANELTRWARTLVPR
jgi:glycosyltransferase involved in cell wall biosynthesis